MTAVEGIVNERRAAAAAWKEWALHCLGRQILDGSADHGAFAENNSGWRDGRAAAYIVSRLIAIRLWSEEIDLDSGAVEISALQGIRFVRRRQTREGLLDLGGVYTVNEAGFPCPGLCEAYERLGGLASGWAGEMREEIKAFLLGAREGLLRFPPRSANHRWAALCAPLAAIHRLFPDERIPARIESFLADGIDCNADGCWHEERSPNYNTVANWGMLMLADTWNRPDLREHVIRNLTFMLHRIQPSGEADTSDSFRQDRAAAGCPPSHYAIARRAALLSGDGRFTTLARLHNLQPGNNDLLPLLFELDRHPGPLPEPKPLPETYERHYPSLHLARKRIESTSLTLFADPGNHFFDTVLDQWGGARRSDDWFCLHHGDIVLSSLKLTTPLGGFGIQPRMLHPDGPGRYRLEGNVEGWEHTLHFRPGRPSVQIPWELEHLIEVHWQDSATLTVFLTASSPNALVADLCLWVRANAILHEGSGLGQPLRPGQAVDFQGGLPILLHSPTRAIELLGLPPGRHRLHPGRTSAIPSKLEQSSASLHLGLSLPVKLELRFRLLAFPPDSERTPERKPPS